MFVSGGPRARARARRKSGFRVFLDLKFHDIPNTVAQACAAATRLGVWMINMHAAGGRAMLVAAREAVARAAAERGERPPLLLAVTVLTSLDADDVAEIGFAQAPDGVVLRLARLRGRLRSRRRGLFRPRGAGVAPRAGCGLHAGHARHPASRKQHARTRRALMTPEAAIANGADYLVIGRPITQAADPAAELARINASLKVGA